jgi:hypothetical protein
MQASLYKTKFKLFIIKDFFISCVSLLASSVLHGQETTVRTINDLLATGSNAASIVVTDLDEGGLFVYQSYDKSPDYGIVFPRKAGGSWVRHYNIALGANPKWWGAKGDGINDDLEALNRATKYCLDNNVILQFPSGIFRITAQWLIGGRFFSNNELFKAAPWSQLPSYVPNEHAKTRALNPLIIRGSGNTCIYGDFSAKELTPIVYYSIKGNGLPNRPSSHTFNHEFSNIAIYGRGLYNGKSLAAPTSIDFNNNQIGLYVVSSDKIKIENCDFIGLKYGLFINTSYWGSVSNTQFEYCQTGLFTIGYNANYLQNLFAQYCKVGFEINGDELAINSINGGHCETGLICKGRYMVINQAYFENTNKAAGNNYQIIVGRGKKDRFYGKANRSTGIIFNAFTVTASGRNAILLDDDLDEVHFNGANINGPIISTNSRNKISLKTAVGSFKVNGPAQLFRQ